MSASDRIDVAGHYVVKAARGATVPALVAALLLSTAHSATAQVGGLVDPSSITAEGLITRLRKAGRTIVERTPETWQDSAAAATAQLRELSDRLEAGLQTRKDAGLARVAEIDGAEVQQGLVALVLAEDLANAIRAHPHEDVRSLLEAFSHNFRRSVGAPGSWSRGRTRVLRLVDPTAKAPHVLGTGKAEPVVVQGLNLHSDDCGSPSVVIESAGGDRLEIEASSRDDGTVTFDAPMVDAPGVYDIEIRVRRKKLILFCGSTTATISVAVLAASPLRLRYAVSTMQAFEQEIVWNAGELKAENGECRDTTASDLFRLPDGWSYASHEWTVYLAEGAVKTQEEVRGDAVYVEYRVRGRPGPFCTGDASLIHGRMEIRGTRERLEAGPETAGTYPRRVGFGERVVVPVDLTPADGAAIARWSIDVRVIFPDGSVQKLPITDGQGPLKDDGPCGAGFSWDPAAGRLELVAPAVNCPQASH